MSYICDVYVHTNKQYPGWYSAYNVDAMAKQSTQISMCSGFRCQCLQGSEGGEHSPVLVRRVVGVWLWQCKHQPQSIHASFRDCGRRRSGAEEHDLCISCSRGTIRLLKTFCRLVGMQQVQSDLTNTSAEYYLLCITCSFWVFMNTASANRAPEVLYEVMSSGYGCRIVCAVYSLNPLRIWCKYLIINMDVQWSRGTVRPVEFFIWLYFNICSLCEVLWDQYRVQFGL